MIIGIELCDQKIIIMRIRPDIDIQQERSMDFKSSCFFRSFISLTMTTGGFYCSVASKSMSNNKPNILYNPLFEPTDGKYTARRMVVWKLINIIMSVFFLMAAVANLNDYDWYIWVPIYTIPALFSLFLILKPALINNSVYNISVSTVLVVYSGYFIYLIVVLIKTIQNSKDVNNPLIHEEGRETVGMFIILFWLVISRFTSLGRPEPIQGNKGILNGILVLTISLAVLPIMAWAVCFIGDNHKHISHCNGMFH